MNKSAKNKLVISRRKSANSIIAEYRLGGNSHLLNHINQYSLLNDTSVVDNKVYGLLSWNEESISVQACETDNADILFIPIEKRFSQFPINCFYIEKDGSDIKIKKELLLESYNGDIELTHTTYNNQNIKIANIHSYVLENGKIIRDIIFSTIMDNKVILTGLSLKSS